METLEAPARRDKHQSQMNRPGYYGKLPQRGDFIRLGLSSNFSNAWDEWLSDGISYSKEVLGNDWLQRYLHAPVWHFYLAKGVMGEHANVGIWFSSMDKVGRYFPFTFCCPIDEAPSNWISNQDVHSFLSRLERIGMVALDEACDIDDVEEALEETHWPLSNQQPYQGSRGKINVQTSSPEPMSGLNNLLFDIVRNDHPQLSFWWCKQGNGATTFKLHDGMPDKSSFLDFI